MGYIGFKLGLGSELVKLFGLTVGVLVSYRTYQAFGDALGKETFLTPEWASALGMVVLILLGYWATTFVLRWLEKLIQVGFQAKLNQVGGLLAGLFRGLMTASVFLVVCQQLPSDRLKESVGERSFSGPAVSRVAPAVYDGLRALPGKLLVRVRAP